MLVFFCFKTRQTQKLFLTAFSEYLARVCVLSLLVFQTLLSAVFLQKLPIFRQASLKAGTVWLWV